ncbi:MAG TPA: hypothetical protein VI670_15285 [Thermoanaerobaculia bacterium]|jgi:hypothetical protein
MKFVVAVAALFLLTAQKPPAACTLLTPAELDAAVGMKVKTPGYFTATPIPNGPAKRLWMTGCLWTLPK